MNYNNIAIDWVEVDAVIASANKIILTTHENPDGDGLGSEVALFHHLAESGKDVKIINCSPTPEMYDFLNIDGCIETFNKDEHSEWVKNVDLAIVFDVGDIKRTRSVKDAIDENNIPIMNIDHHPHPENHSFTYNIVDIKSAATGCMVRSYLNTARKKPLTKEICEGIYVAVMTDTGCFRYSNTDTFCHSIAIECLEKGVNASSIYQIVYENSSKTRVSILGEMISNIGYDIDGKFAWSIVTDSMMKKYHAAKNDLDGFADFIRSIKGVEVALIIYETDTNSCRINFRSSGRFTVNNIAKYFNGGGHAFASGAVIKKPLDEAKRTVIEKTKKMILDQIRVEN
jgi:phosphoesterase RecJ-like protein